MEFVLPKKKKKKMSLLFLHGVKFSVQTSKAGKKYYVLTFLTPGFAGRCNSEMGITVWFFRLTVTWELQQNSATFCFPTIQILVPSFP